MAIWNIYLEEGKEPIQEKLPCSYKSALRVASDKYGCAIQIEPFGISLSYPCFKNKSLEGLRWIQFLVDGNKNTVKRMRSTGVIQPYLGCCFSDIKRVEDQLAARVSYLKSNCYPLLKAEFLTELDKLGITEKEYYFKGSDWYSRRERFGLE